MKTFKDGENVFDILNKIEKFSSLNSRYFILFVKVSYFKFTQKKRVKTCCNFRFIYWQQSVFLPIYLEDLYENVNSPNKIHVNIKLNFFLSPNLAHFLLLKVFYLGIT